MPCLRRIGALLAVLLAAAGFAVAASAPAASLAPRSASAGLIGTAATPGLAAISVGDAAACGIRTGGTLACWGDGSVVDSPDGTFAQVSVGTNEACALETDGSMQCWGGDDPSPALLGTFRSIGVGTASGTTYVCGLGIDSTVTCTSGSPLGSFRQIAVGDDAACGVQTDGTVTCWGTDAQAATPGTYTQVGVGTDAACALQTDGHISCWGTGALNTTPEQSLTFSQLVMSNANACGLQTDGQVSCFGTDDPQSSPAGTYVAIGLGAFGSCGVQTDGKAACWTTGTAAPPQYNFGHPQVSAGTSTTCGIRTNGTLECWGMNQPGQRPDDTTYTQVATGATHSCAVLTDGTLSCWGDANDDTTETPTTGSFVQIAVGDAFSCALANDASISCWGDITGTPSGTFVAVSAGTNRACAIATDGTLSCWGDTGVEVDSSVPNGTFVDVSVGDDFACGVKSDGTLACWGSVAEAAGALAAPSGMYSTVSAGTGYACALATDGTTACWGTAPDGLPSDDFVQLSAGSDYACGITDAAVVECWGTPGTDSGQTTPPTDGLVIGPWDQGLAFTVPDSPTVDDSYTAVITPGSSANPVTFVSDTTGVCTTDPVDDSDVTVTFLHAQGCTLHAIQAGTVDLAPGDVAHSFGIDAATPTITISAVPATPVKGGSFLAAAQSSGHDDGVFSVSVSGTPNDTCSYDGDTGFVSLDHAGSCTVTADEAASSDDDYAVGSGSQTFDVGQLAGTVSITSTAPSEVKVHDSAYTVQTQAGGSSHDVTLRVTTPSVCSLSGNQVSFDHHGDCIVEADQAGDRDYTDAPPSQQDIRIGSAAQAINVSNTPTAPVVSDQFTPNTGDAEPSGNPVTFTVDPSTTNAACSVTSGVVHFDHAGSCVLDGAVAASGDGDYAEGSRTLPAIAVGKAAQTIGWPTVPGGAYVGDQYTPNAAATPAGNPTYKIDPATASGVCTLSGGKVQFTGQGACKIDANQSGSADYTAAPQVQQSIAVSRVGSSVDLDLSLDEVVYGQATTVTADVTHSPSNRGAPDGTVQFTVAGDAGDPVPITNGTAAEQFTAPAVEEHGDPIVADFTPTDSAKFDTAMGNQTLQVDKADTTSTVGVTPDSVTAAVDAKSPGSGVPGGTVTFTVDGSPVGSAQQLSDGVATLAYSVPPGKTRTVAVTYNGDSNFVLSTKSLSRHDPKLSAKVTSAQAKQHGWYRKPVTVTFSCTENGAPLTQACPAPVTVSTDAASKSVAASILATNGGAASYSTNVSLDQTRPTITIAGVVDGNTYIGTAPKVRCLAQDHLSGLNGGCKVKLTTDKSGLTHYTATAQDEAGNVQTAKGSYRVQRFYLREAIYDSANNVYYVQTDTDYTLVALSNHRPRYIKPSRGKPHKSGPKLTADGRQSGFDRWSTVITFPHSLAKHPHWNIGVKAGGKLTVLPLMISG